MANDFDLVIRGGTVVTGDSESSVDLGVYQGRITQLGGSMSATREIDATGKLVFPGGIDMHVHLAPPWADDFASGSRAAAAGGVTTIGHMASPDPGETLTAVIERFTEEASRDSMVDFVLHPVLRDPGDDAIAEIPRLAEQGHTSLKMFMLRDFDARASDFLRALSVAGQNGMLTLVHCEDACLIGYAKERLLSEGHRALHYHAQTRPARSEWSAVTRMITFADAVDAPVYIVHLASAAALAEAREAQARGQRVYVETRPLYLNFTREIFDRSDGALYIGNPPPGDAADQEALWSGLRAGHVHTYCTDHAPWKRGDKLDPALTVATARSGVPELDTYMPLLYSQGVRTGRLSIQRFVQVTSTNAAKLFGLFPRKGTIAVGSDADLVVWDPEASRVVRGSDSVGGADHSLYEGWELTGVPSATISRGEVIYSDGVVTGRPGQGRLVPRGRTRAL